MAEIAQILRALTLYGLSLAIAVPNLWLLAKMLRVGRLTYPQKLEIFSWGMLVCLPAAFLNSFLLSNLQGWFSATFAVPAQAAGVVPPERTWLENLLIVAPVEEGLKGLAFAVILLKFRRGESTLRYVTAAPVYWAAILAAGFASFENVIYALRSDAATTGFQVIGLRAVTSSLVHATATSMLGLAVGLRRRYLLPVWLVGTVGGMSALLIHAGWNVLARVEWGLGPGHVLMQAGVAVAGSSLPSLLAYAFGLIDPVPASQPPASSETTDTETPKAS
ncbi:MAG TPA: PrsW family glutamic-type intramembrane protease [Planctomycetota bacterium]|nr:PrsW family glutamic-type intramembrane protease [Planctomycetota bacterium]